MKKKNIESLLEMTKSHLDGNLDSITYGMDFPYEVEKRYHGLLKEDKEIAEMIYDCLVEDGAYLYDTLSEEELREKILGYYNYIHDIYYGKVDLI